MKVSACLVTRGDVEMQDIINSLPNTWEVVIWDNSGTITRSDGWAEVCTDLAVYGRYAAIQYASHDLVFVQDDDVIVSNPQAIVEQWRETARLQRLPTWDLGPGNVDPHGHVVCNMPQEFRPHYPDSGLVGFGAAFHRDAPGRAFKRYLDGTAFPEVDQSLDGKEREMFLRRADNIFTVLTPRVLVDVSKQDCAWASDPNRMWRQSDHTSERDRMIELARQVRDS